MIVKDADTVTWVHMPSKNTLWEYIQHSEIILIMVHYLLRAYSVLSREWEKKPSGLDMLLGAVGLDLLRLSGA